MARIGAWNVDTKTTTHTWTKELFVIYEMDSFVPLQLEKILALELPSYRHLHLNAIRELVEKGIPFDIEVETLTLRGNHRWLRIIGRGLFDSEGRITHRIGITQDITDRKRLEQEACENLRKYKTLFEEISDAVLLIDEETAQIEDTNSGSLKLYGYARDELLGKEFPTLGTDPEFSLQILRSRHTFVPLQWHKKKDGTLFPVELTLNCIRIQGAWKHILVARDITPRIEAEQKIHSLLREKELLLREVHHRIKNHMQTVESLLTLQAQASEDPYVIDTLEEAKSRLRSLGILYDRLYRTQQIQHLSLKQYLPRLVRELMDSFPRKVPISLEIDVEDIVLPVKQLTYLGIIVNELVTNALKYAFIGKSEGRIRVSAHEIKDGGQTERNEKGHTQKGVEQDRSLHHGQKQIGSVSLIVEDDGIGIPESLHLQDPSSFGLQLIRILVDQLGGSLRVSHQKGTRFEIEFQKHP